MYLFILKLFIICFSLTLTFNLKAESGFDMSNVHMRADKFLVFKNVFVFQTDTDTEVLLGNIFHISTTRAFNEKNRFNMFDKAKLTEKLFKKGLTTVDLSKNEEIISRSNFLDLDGFIEPVIKRTENKITLALRLLDSEGQVFAVEKIEDFSYQDREKFDAIIDILVDRLISHIPYIGLISKIENDLIFVDVGKQSGLKQNDVLRVFEIKEIKRHPVLKTVIDFEREPVGRLVIVEARENYSITKLRSIKPGSQFRPFMKIDRTTIAKDPFLYPEPLKTFRSTEGELNYGRFGSSFGSLEIRAVMGYFKHVSTSDNSILNQTVKSFPFPEVMFLGDLWLTSKIILGTVIQGGVVTLKDSSMNPTSVNGMLNHFSFLLKYRFILGKSIRDPQIIPALGVYRYSFSPDKTDPLKITGKTYYGFSIGGQLMVPIDNKYTLSFRGLANPFAKIKEKPLQSGTKKSTLGYLFDVGISYWLNDKVSLNGGVKFDSFRTEFSGTSPRNTPNATASLLSSGIYFGTTLNF